MVATAPPQPRYSAREEIANSVTHGVGAILAIGGITVLVAFAALAGTARHVAACALYGASLIILYTASTLYHGVPAPRAKATLQFFDHAAIFLLIAGTYTPFTLITLRGTLGWALFAGIWSAALLGIILQVVLPKRYHWVSVVFYLGMGWAAVVGVRPLLRAMSHSGLLLLFGGGLAYTLGVVFYLWRRLPYHHAIWHLFVLAGSGLHYFSILYGVIPWGT